MVKVRTDLACDLLVTFPHVKFSSWEAEVDEETASTLLTLPGFTRMEEESAHKPKARSRRTPKGQG